MSSEAQESMTYDIVAQLRLWSDNAKEQDATDVVVGLGAAADEIERLRWERDNARRIVCHLLASRSRGNYLQRAMSCARAIGWDCFKEFV